MAISVLDVRDTLAAPRVRVPARPVAATSDAVAPRRAPVAAVAPRRAPVAVVAAGLLGVLESMGLLAVALTSVDTVLSAVPGWVAAGGLVVLSGFVVLCAGSGAALLDGAGSTMLRGVACAEIALVAVLLVIATVWPVLPGTPLHLPLPALGLLALTLPVGKLLLVDASSSQAWIAAGPRFRTDRRDPVHAHRLLATVTLGLIGLSLGALAVLSPVPGGGAGLTGTVSDVVYQP